MPGVPPPGGNQSQPPNGRKFPPNTPPGEGSPDSDKDGEQDKGDKDGEEERSKRKNNIEIWKCAAIPQGKKGQSKIYCLNTKNKEVREDSPSGKKVKDKRIKKIVENLVGKEEEED